MQGIILSVLLLLAVPHSWTPYVQIGLSMIVYDIVTFSNNCRDSGPIGQ